MTEEELNRLMVLAEQYKAQLDQLDTQMSYIQQAINEYNKSKITIDNISEKEKNSDVILPIGGGSYIDAKAKNPKKILFDVGAGYIIEKDADDAIKKIDSRKYFNFIAISFVFNLSKCIYH